MRRAVEAGELEELRVGAGETVMKGGGDREEDRNGRHDDLGADAEAEPEDEKWRDGDVSHWKVCSVGPLFCGVRFDENTIAIRYKHSREVSCWTLEKSVFYVSIWF